MIFTAIILLPQAALYSSPYELSPIVDGTLAGAGLTLFGISLYTGKNVESLSDEEIASLSKDDINNFDRSAADNWSPAAGKWSDIVITPLIISPLGFLLENETRNDFFIIGVMYGESILLTHGLTGTAKNIIQRERPFTYNSDAPYSNKKEKDAVRSFYSGHSANAFNSAVFVSTVFSDYYPHSLWRYAVWGTTLSTAALTGYLRYKAGMHYPSDIFTGAAIGSSIGYLVPMLHRTGNKNISLQVIIGEEKIIALLFAF